MKDLLLAILFFAIVLVLVHWKRPALWKRMAGWLAAIKGVFKRKPKEPTVHAKLSKPTITPNEPADPH